MAAFPDAIIDRTDGIKVQLPRGWFLARASVSEDKVSLRVEGETAEDLESLVRSFLPMVRGQRRLIEEKLGGQITPAGAAISAS